MVAALVAVAVYANSTQNGLTYDDRTVIVRNQAAWDPTDVRRIFLASSWSTNVEQTIAYRPLTTWSFALNYAAHGAEPLGYHVVNVLGHAIVSALVVVLAATLGLSAMTAGLAGVLFAVHPIHTEAVANVVGRAEILAAGLALLALIARRRGERSAAWSAVSLLAYGVALLAKEHVIALLVLLPLMDLLVGDGGSVRAFVRRLRGARLGFYVGLVAVTVAYVALRTAAIGDVGVDASTISRIPMWQNVTARAGAGERVLTALYVMAHACWLLLWPVSLSADYSFAHITLVRSPAEPRALVGLAALLVACAATMVLRRRPRALFWMALGMLPYGVVSNLPFPVGTIFAERLLYLPSVAFAVGAAWLIASRAPRTIPANTCRAVAALLIAGLGLRTVARNGVWRDNMTLAESMVASAPRSVQAHHLLANSLFDAGRYPEAVQEYQAALAIHPDDVDVLFNAGAAHMLMQHKDEALRLFDRVTELEPKRFAAWIDKAAISNQAGDFEPGLRAAEQAIAVRGDVPNGYVMRGFALRGLGRLAEARASFETALRLPGVGQDALFGLAATALEQGDARTAAAGFEHLASVGPSADVYRGLIASYRQLGRDGDAARAIEEARRRFPDDPVFRP